ncbi:DUF4158 domain-containing protein [Kribbella sp. NPDC026596]|uniref:DUF4158 domain-containing protein n=1 Tax=Kribbella sp. NPDC026596 TaxID=3155122 RepID=UPI003403C36C
MDRSIELDELVEMWTLLDDEQGLVAGKRGATRLGFVLLLKFYIQHGQFPRGRSALPAGAVRYVADQVKVPASELGIYEWAGRTNRYHQAQIRESLGFRERSVRDAEKLTAWLAVEVCEDERGRDRVRDQLLVRCRDQRIEPPTSARVDRIVRSALHQAEVAMTSRVAGRLSPATAARLSSLVTEPEHDGEDVGESVLALVRSDPGNVSLESMLTEIRKLGAVRAIELPPGLFADVGAPGAGGVARSGGGGVAVASACPSGCPAVDAARGDAPRQRAGDHRYLG